MIKILYYWDKGEDVKKCRRRKQNLDQAGSDQPLKLTKWQRAWDRVTEFDSIQLIKPAK